MLHTITLYNQINTKQYNQIKDYLYNTSNTQVYKSKRSDTCKTLITHKYKSQGISRFTLSEIILPELTYYSVWIKFNPSRILNKDNPHDLMQQADIMRVNDKFSELVKGINPDLPELMFWKTDRIDYSVNIITPYVALYVELFQRCNKPSKYYKDLKSEGGKREQRKNSLYLMTKTYTINDYDKQAEVIANGGSPEEIEAAKDILRIEVQCKKGKINNLKKNDDNIISTELYNFMDKDLSREVLLKYYDKTIGSGDFYSFKEASKIIKVDLDLTKSMKAKLIKHLWYINNFKSIHNAKQKFNNNPLFNKYLKLIRGIGENGINPVLIPRRKNIPFLPNIKTEIIMAYESSQI